MVPESETLTLGTEQVFLTHSAMLHIPSVGSFHVIRPLSMYIRQQDGQNPHHTQDEVQATRSSCPGGGRLSSRLSNRGL